MSEHQFLTINVSSTLIWGKNKTISLWLSHEMRWLIMFIRVIKNLTSLAELERPLGDYGPSWPLSLVHTSDISIKTSSIRKHSLTFPLKLAKIKQQESFFLSTFVRFLAYSCTMILRLCFTTILMSQAWLHSFVLPFVLISCLCLCSSVNHALSFTYDVKSFITLMTID